MYKQGSHLTSEQLQQSLETTAQVLAVNLTDHAMVTTDIIDQVFSVSEKRTFYGFKRYCR